MKVINYSTNDEISVEEAVQKCLDGGALETSVDNAADMMGKLVAILVDRDVLTAGDLRILLNYLFQVED